MYAIGGYNTYVPGDEIERNECMKAKKNKIVYTYIQLKLGNPPGRWLSIDIALVKVESPYDFNDQTYKEICSYTPTMIPINYDTRFQKTGADGLILGWGHMEKWRETGDEKNYNVQYLQYASIRIMDKNECKKHYKRYTNMDFNIIEKYMICTSDKGDLDENGNIVWVGPPPAKQAGCAGGLRLNNNNEPCEEDQQRHTEVLRSNRTNDSNINKHDSNIRTNNKIFMNHSGICQNDHGGPLITWVGAKEVLIGVASVFHVTDDSKCIGPYLYTSTACNGVFIYCVLSNSPDFPDNDPKRRDKICNRTPQERGYDTYERHVTWASHPDGSADNQFSVSKRKFAVSSVRTKARIFKPLLEGFIKLENETIAVRPQRPLEK